MGIGFGFQIYQIMFLIVFGIAMSSVLMTTIRSMKEWNKKQPLSQTDCSGYRGDQKN